MEYTTLEYEKVGGVAIVTLNQPEQMNALRPETAIDFENVTREMEADDEVRVTIITGAGRAFCAGHNMKTVLADGQAADNRPRRPRNPRAGGWGSIYIQEYSKPIIAAVNGPAYGGGFVLALLCDMIIASTDARFCFPMTRIGIMPGGGGGGPMLALRVGLTRALEMAIMARPIDGQEAYQYGLANKVVPPDQLMPEAMAWADEIASLAPISVRLAKEDIKESTAHHINRLSNSLRFRMSMRTKDAHEGHRAWRERRAPVFKGR